MSISPVNIANQNPYYLSGIVYSYLDEEQDDATFITPIVKNIFLNRMVQAHEYPAPLPYLDWKDRPESVKNAIGGAFANISSYNSSRWGCYNGDDRYYICEINDTVLIAKLIQSIPESQKDIYILDVGAGNFQWGRAMANFVGTLPIRPDITIHIISVRGERNPEAEIIESGQCRIHNIGNCKIEDLIAELKKRGLDLEGKVNLVVSRWCLRHLMDPVGTFSQIYNLLQPGTGYFLGDGFFFLYEDEKEPSMVANISMIAFLLKTESPFLMREYTDNRSLNRFILKRVGNTGCPLPMEYIDIQFSGQKILNDGKQGFTRFRSRKNEGPRRMIAQVKGKNLYGSSKLFRFLQTNKLLLRGESIHWQPIVTPVNKEQ